MITRPLMELLKKGALFIWSTLHDAAFHALKQALTFAPVLALSDFSRRSLWRLMRVGRELVLCLLRMATH